MGTKIRFTRPDGKEAEGYLAKPGRANAPGVVVIQEWWGLQDQIRGICDRYAALEERLKKKPKDFADAFSRIRGRPVTHSETMNQMALRPADGKAVIRVRD